MSKTLAQIEKDGYETLTQEEADVLQSAILSLDNAVNHRWPQQWGEAFDAFLKHYGWHIRMWMHPDELIPFIKQGNEVVDQYMIKKLRRGVLLIWWQAWRRFPDRRKMINSAFRAHIRGDYSASVPVFLLLSDGIFRELTGGDLFSKKQQSKVTKPFRTPLFTHIIEAVSNGYVIALRFDNDEYLKYPNVLSRNKILHGADQKYNTRTNSYKALSQFEFVTESVWLALNEKDI